MSCTQYISCHSNWHNNIKKKMISNNILCVNFKAGTHRKLLLDTLFFTETDNKLVTWLVPWRVKKIWYVDNKKCKICGIYENNAHQVPWWWMSKCSCFTALYPFHDCIIVYYKTANNSCYYVVLHSVLGKLKPTTWFSSQTCCTFPGEVAAGCTVKKLLQHVCSQGISLFNLLQHMCIFCKV